MEYNSDTEKTNNIGLVTRTYSLDGQMGVKEKLKDLDNCLALNRSTSVFGGVNHLTKLRRSMSTAVQALKMVKFINKADDVVSGWPAVEKRFVKITAITDGLLPRSKFGECIGWDSEDFASALFDSLLRRRCIRTDMINKEELREFWEQISDQSFDSRLRTFFDMVDKDSDGKITEDEISELIDLSSAANNLSNIQRRRDEYAALIMEELDPDKIGYILVESFESLLMHAIQQNVRKTSKGSTDLSALIMARLTTRRDHNLLKRYYLETWMHLTAPTALYACERLIRAFRSSSVTIRKVSVYPANVFNLTMSKPRTFEYRSGQYILINCPLVSLFEWHLFSLTSAPQDDYLSVHIKSVGDWTEGVRNTLTEMCRPPQDGDANNLGFPRFMIDGPYGAPAQDYKKYEVVLLIGLGIGAAPMISIIKDINHNTETNEHTQQGNNKEGFKTRKAYFYWLTKEQGSYDWFKNTMNEIAERDTSNVIELHNYCTSIYEEGDARSAMILMLQSLNHAKHGVDIISGTRIMTHFAKPNWRNVYKQIARDHQGSHVGVFYCGELALAKELRHLAVEFTLGTTTRFTFHKENFYPEC